MNGGGQVSEERSSKWKRREVSQAAVGLEEAERESSVVAKQA